ncbi:MAG: AraC family transcriptional regulator [Myxococcaceae bacterium]|nr:AraC family transcriptional regulator [Myxococcaceae bacterium]
MSTLSGHVLQRLVGFVNAAGHDAAALCREVGLRPESLTPGSRVPYRVAEDLGLRAAELMRDENFGLHLGQHVEASFGFDAGALLLMASPTLGIALDRLIEHARYWGDGDRMALIGTTLRYTAVSTPAGRRHSDECAAAEIVVGARLLSGHEVVPRAVRFRHPAPRNTAEHAALFRCPIQFDAPHTEVELDDATLALKFPHANETFAAIFEKQVEQCLARLPNAAGLAEQVKATARSTIGAGRCSLAETARHLGLSTRSLQRQLADAGTSFADVVDSARREMAMEFLNQRLPLKEIAFLLGYAEPSAFHHAFKRWYGATPEEVRSQRFGVNSH